MVLAPAADLVVDWNALFLQLQREGYSTPDIEHFTGIPRGTFMGWKNSGAQPRHPEGERMIAFWAQATSLARDALPMKQAEFSAAKIGR
ncbi:hypothetical protein [Cupriavidus oxalaticus]|uniref:hypothetical protein n=1 Tax=Cupriavidus oxalaticus TaxID=96344 RepID=UPI00317F17B4